jgi:N-acyl-phosphatidylethanolamine-hydrolysing phospholipase D
MTPRTDEHSLGARRAAHHGEHGFENPWPSRPPAGHTRFLRWALAHRTTKPRPVDPPRGTFTRATPSFDAPRAAHDEITVTWVGHATFLIQVGGLNVLTDPVWSDRASPVWWAGPRRWVEPGIDFDALPPVDIVLISHDHYDHLDRRTLRRLVRDHSRATWMVPLGVASLVGRPGRLYELDWWDEAMVADIRLACVPAQHTSARGVRDRGRRLWCGWVIATPESRIYFAGDTAYYQEIVQVAAGYGPFDVTLLPIGGYEPRSYMRYLHMNPEEAVQTFGDLRAASPPATQLGVFVPMHWGTFKLTDEAMDEPPRRVRRAWREAELPDDALWLLRHGETKRMSAR